MSPQRRTSGSRPDNIACSRKTRGPGPAAVAGGERSRTHRLRAPIRPSTVRGAGRGSPTAGARAARLDGTRRRSPRWPPTGMTSSTAKTWSGARRNGSAARSMSASSARWRSRCGPSTGRTGCLRKFAAFAVRTDPRHRPNAWLQGRVRPALAGCSIDSSCPCGGGTPDSRESVASDWRRGMMSCGRLNGFARGGQKLAVAGRGDGPVDGFRRLADGRVRGPRRGAAPQVRCRRNGGAQVAHEGVDSGPLGRQRRRPGSTSPRG